MCAQKTASTLERIFSVFYFNPIYTFAGRIIFIRACLCVFNKSIFLIRTFLDQNPQILVYLLVL